MGRRLGDDGVRCRSVGLGRNTCFGHASLFDPLASDRASNLTTPADLRKRGSLIGANDLFIAAHASALPLTLVTNNTAEFERVHKPAKGAALEIPMNALGWFPVSWRALRA
jgi:hypothetical protein